MKLKELYNMDDAYKCKTRNNAIELFRELRRKVGNNFRMYTESRILSGRQIVTSENAIRMLMKDEYIGAIQETYDFLDNYRDNNHELSNQEYAVLNLILLVAEM